MNAKLRTSVWYGADLELGIDARAPETVSACDASLRIAACMYTHLSASSR